MYKILLITHGNLGEELKNTLKMFSSDVDHVYFVGLDESGVENFRKNLLEKIDEIYNPNEQVLVLADLFGGTPFNIASIELASKYTNIEVVAGVNLSMLLEASLMKEMDLINIIDNLIVAGNDSIIKFEKRKVVIDEEDE